jgi:hypothetical protein
MLLLDDIRQRLRHTLYTIDLVESQAYLRYDTEDSDSKEQWDNYIMVVEELEAVGLYLDDPYVEHDCITGTILYLPKCCPPPHETR